MRYVPIASLALLLAPPPLAAAEPRSPRATAEAMFAAINAHDATALAALYADDAVIISSDSCQPSVGPESVRRGHEALLKAMPDLRVEPGEGVVEGNRLAMLFTAYSKALGPTGKTTLADFLTVKDGKIVRDVTIFNPGMPCR